MILPCLTCKYKTVSEQGFRQFIGCNDKEKKDKNFHYDDFWYHHKCDAYEKEDNDGQSSITNY